MQSQANLKSLCRQPFALLRELERRSRAAVAGHAGGISPSKEWVGVAFRIGAENFLAPREEIREVLIYPPAVTRVPGAKAWIKGVANVRGQLLPIVDLRAFLSGGTTSPARATRVLVANHREVPAGLMVDEVLGFRRFVETEHSDEWPPTIIRCETYISGAYRRGRESWPVFSPNKLVGSPEFLQAAE